MNAPQSSEQQARDVLAGSGATHRFPRRFLVMVLALAGVLLAVHFSPLRQHVEDVDLLSSELLAAGSWAPVLMVLAATMLLAIGLPRLPVYAIAALTFGWWQGLLLAQIGCLAGAYLFFLFARWGGGEWARRQLAARPRLHRLSRQPTFLTVVLLRQLPLGSFVVNTLLALSRVRHSVFLAGSFCGFLPQGLAVCLLASGLTDDSRWLVAAKVAGAFACLAVMAVSARTLLARARLEASVDAAALGPGLVQE